MRQEIQSMNQSSREHRWPLLLLQAAQPHGWNEDVEHRVLKPGCAWHNKETLLLVSFLESDRTRAGTECTSWLTVCLRKLRHNTLTRCWGESNPVCVYVNHSRALSGQAWTQERERQNHAPEKAQRKQYGARYSRTHTFWTEMEILFMPLTQLCHTQLTVPRSGRLRLSGRSTSRQLCPFTQPGPHHITQLQHAATGTYTLHFQPLLVLHLTC